MRHFVFFMLECEEGDNTKWAKSLKLEIYKMCFALTTFRNVFHDGVFNKESTDCHQEGDFGVS